MTPEQEKGNALIDKLEEHILEVLKGHPDREAGLHFDALREATGLTIDSVHGKEIWDRAFAVLLVELAKKEEPKIRSDVPPGSLKSKHWMNAKIWPLE